MLEIESDITVLQLDRRTVSIRRVFGFGILSWLAIKLETLFTTQCIVSEFFRSSFSISNVLCRLW